MSIIPAVNVGELPRFGNHGVTVIELAAGVPPDARAPFTDLNGAAVDPTSVTLHVLKPDGSTLAYGWPVTATNGTLTKESTGRFYMDVLIDQAGRWKINQSGTGLAQTTTGDYEVWANGSTF